MAETGFRRFEDLIGRTDRLEIVPDLEGKELSLNLNPLLHIPDLPARIARRKKTFFPFSLKGALDLQLIENAERWLLTGRRSEKVYEVNNTNRAVGSMLSGHLERKGALPLKQPLEFTFSGTAGQSFGAFCGAGLILRLEGAANDYFGKGLSGGVLIAQPHPDSPLSSGENAIAGNTALYGATSGEAHLRGSCGERFAVRNSGASAVAEGIGNHGCEYMTGGMVMILGPVGRNFGAGMGGGVAYILDEDDDLKSKCHAPSVLIENIGTKDEEQIKLFLERHLRRTGSTIAAHLVDDWAAAKHRFRKVTPRDKPAWKDF